MYIKETIQFYHLLEHRINLNQSKLQTIKLIIRRKNLLKYLDKKASFNLSIKKKYSNKLLSFKKLKFKKFNRNHKEKYFLLQLEIL